MSRNINILHLSPGLTIVQNKVKSLALLSKYKHHIYCWDHWEGKKQYEAFKERFANQGIQIYEGLHGYNIWKSMKDIVNLVRQYDINILYSYFLMGNILASFVKFFVPSLKVIVSFVGSIKPKGIYKTLLSNAAYRKADMFTYVSKYVEHEQKKHFPVLNYAPCKVIYNCALAREVTGVRKNTKTDIIKLVDIAGINAHKNLFVLVDMTRILKDVFRKSLTLTIIGPKTGSYVKKLEDYIKQQSVSENVILSDYQFDIGNFLADADCFVHSANVEGFGISVVEAMFARKPIIVSNAGALPELIINGESGLLADPDNAQEWAEKVLYLLENPNIANYLAQNAFQRAKRNFSIEKFVHENDELCEMLV